MSPNAEGPVAVLSVVDDVDRDSLSQKEELPTTPTTQSLEHYEPKQSSERKAPSAIPSLRKEFGYDNTVIVFDWDDTLLPSSFITDQKLRLDGPLDIDEESVAQLAAHAESVKELLQHAQKYGTVMIITNAETGWVELSCAKFIPSVAETLADIDVISARSTYEPAFPDSPLDWKYAAFSEELRHFFADHQAEQTKNVLSFGDGVHERDAVHLVTANMENVRTKSVKFVERPSIEQLRRQVELIRSCFEQMCTYDADLDLMLTIQILQS